MIKAFVARTWLALAISFLFFLASASGAPKEAAASKAHRNFLILKVYYLLNKESGNLSDGINNFSARSDNVSVTYSGSYEVKAGRGLVPGSDPMNLQILPAWSPIQDTDTIQVDVDNRTVNNNLDVGEGDSRALQTRTESWRGSMKVPFDFNGTTFVLNSEKHRYDFILRLNLGRGERTKFISHSMTSVTVGDKSLGGGEHEESSDTLGLSASKGPPYIMLDIKDEPLPKDESFLNGTRRIPWGDSGAYFLVSWHLTNYEPQPELIVTSRSYPKWRPSALPGPQAGEPLDLKAELRGPNGDRPTVKVKRFEWQLEDTSREPGIAMNYPVDCKDDKTPDLKFELQSGQTSDDPELQKLKEEDPTGFVTRATILPFDWGAWSIVKVRAVLDDGKVIEGKYQDSEEPIRLPLRKGDSYISDHWKETHGVPNASDKDDDDAEPKGNGQNGDGFSLYEEYRGWIVNGQHEEGDPKVKDYFVLNRMGDQAATGLSLFAQVTGLRVHYTLREDEMKVTDLADPDPYDRIMNANRTEKSPRKGTVPQYGMVLITGNNGNASQAVRVRAHSGLFRPKEFKYAIITSSVLNNGGKRTKHIQGVDTEFDLLASTIAHELGHTVGLRHHGEVDEGWAVWSAITDASGNVTGFGENGHPIQVIHEGSGRIMPAAELARWFQDEDIWVGKQHGQHSGFEDCIMRYDVARAYIPPDQANVRYYIDGEMVGAQLCTQKDGVIVNQKDHDPMPRYGDAAMGKCKSQICVRDDAP